MSLDTALTRLLGIEQVAHTPSPQPIEPGTGARGRGDGRPGPPGTAEYQGEQFVGRSVEPQLQLAVLIDGALGGDGRRRPFILAQAFGPELTIPRPYESKTAHIRHHHRQCFSLFVMQKLKCCVKHWHILHRCLFPECIVYFFCSSPQCIHIHPLRHRRE